MKRTAIAITLVFCMAVAVIGFFLGPTQLFTTTTSPRGAVSPTANIRIEADSSQADNPMSEYVKNIPAEPSLDMPISVSLSLENTPRIFNGRVEQFLVYRINNISSLPVQIPIESWISNARNGAYVASGIAYLRDRPVGDGMLINPGANPELFESKFELMSGESVVMRTRVQVNWMGMDFSNISEIKFCFCHFPVIYNGKVMMLSDYMAPIRLVR